MEDVYEELDAQVKPSDRAFAITLTDADYKIAKINNQQFASQEEAYETVPTILNSKYPHLEVGTAVTVTFNYSHFPSNNFTVTEVSEHTVTEDEYVAAGFTYKNFDTTDDMITFLNTTFPKREENEVMYLTYTWYNSSAYSSRQTVTSPFIYVNGEWNKVYEVTEEDYATVGMNPDGNTRRNFSSYDTDNLPYYFNRFLGENAKGADQVGDIHYVLYKYYSSSTGLVQRVMAMRYNGNGWAQVATEEATVQFAKEGNTWVPDLRIQYTLLSADYTWIADEHPNVADAAAVASLKRYRNFDTSMWSSEAIVKALGTLLKAKFPDAEVGQKFNVTYVFYSGATGTTSITLELNESGNYQLAE
ncbi:hypothetical protein PKOR_02380 [Pontibacter korlensis]|uniref:DUF5017 domain-containing protein n=2 Tax=Pontibacter korlensis TaxID=400092 RepID=A0A0E3UV43_9BACT|nr:hypothetical protein PKOR_02380 [Pontibacter korlensis]